MPVIHSDGCPIRVEIEGAADAPVLMLSNSLGADLSMWAPQAAAFSRRFRLVRYDCRGHGESGLTDGPYTIERLARDALAVMDGLGVQRVNWCGLSMGGMVGQWLGAFAPERIERLVLANTSCYYADKERWNERIKSVHECGVAAVADAVLALWFTAQFHQREPKTVARFKEMMLATPAEGYVACCEAVRDMDHREILARIGAPTLVVAGRQDLATPLEAGEYIAKRIPGARLAALDAAHISNVEQAGAFTAEALQFLTS
jgi:3-oxoadipate enol-lactonase